MDMYQDWPRLSSALFYDDAATAIDWLCRAFGFEVRIKVPGPDNSIIHSELVYEDAVIMVGSALRKDRLDRDFCISPRKVGGANTQSLGLRVADADAHCARARAAGARIEAEPQTVDHGHSHGQHRTYAAVDPEGHHWWFIQVVPR
jgi:uncharacterized glyoxalase superfamily protein PhnB